MWKPPDPLLSSPEPPEDAFEKYLLSLLTRGAWTEKQILEKLKIRVRMKTRRKASSESTEMPDTSTTAPMPFSSPRPMKNGDAAGSGTSC